MLYDPHRRWSPRGICRWEDRGLFFAPGGQPDRVPSRAVQDLWSQAKEICAMCPVLKECRRDTLGEEYGVYGGLDETERYRIRIQLSAAIDRWDERRRMAWAKEAYTLRKAGFSYSTIQTQTGLSKAAVLKLSEIWREHLGKQPEPGSVVDLKLPEPETESAPFPARQGRRHAWVRHRGIVSDAWYRGETPDGAWVCVTVESGKGQAHKWIRREDVHLYRPQAVVILNYIGRPDDSTRTPAA